MKIIDLLNKIANDEDVPKRIKYISHYFDYSETEKDYYEGIGYEYEYLLKNCSTVDLNDEVEIIEDKPFSERVEEIYNRHIDYIYNKEDKKIVKLKKDNFGNNKDLDEVDSDIYFIVDKINELIDYINNGD